MQTNASSTIFRLSSWRSPRRVGQLDPQGVLAAAWTTVARYCRSSDLRRNNQGAFATVAGFIAALFSTSLAIADVQTARLLAKPLDLAVDRANDIQLQIWRDKLPEILADRKKLIAIVPTLKLKLATEVFTAAFKDGQNTIIVSAVDYQCNTVPGVENTLVCPARVARVTNGTPHIIANVDALTIAMKRGNAGFDAGSNADTENATFLTYDTDTHQLAISHKSDGTTDGPFVLTHTN